VAKNGDLKISTDFDVSLTVFYNETKLSLLIK